MLVSGSAACRFNGQDLQRLAEDAHGFSGADLASLAREACSPVCQASHQRPKSRGIYIFIYFKGLRPWAGSARRSRGEQFLSMLRPLNSLKISKR